jgi:hypothetical protein
MKPVLFHFNFILSIFLIIKHSNFIFSTCDHAGRKKDLYENELETSLEDGVSELSETSNSILVPSSNDKTVTGMDSDIKPMHLESTGPIDHKTVYLENTTENVYSLI